MRNLSPSLVLAVFAICQGCTATESKSSATPQAQIKSKATAAQLRAQGLDPESLPGGKFGADNSPSPGVSKPFKKGMQTSPTGLQWRVIKSGQGEPPKPGQKISIHFQGRLADGSIFDSTEGKSPVTFPVGRGQLNKGMEEALMQMTIGEKRVLTIPPALAYGEKGRPGLIPPNSTLQITVELVGLLEEEG